MTSLSGTSMRVGMTLRGDIELAGVTSQLTLDLTVSVDDLESLVAGVAGQGVVTGHILLGTSRAETTGTVTLLVPSDEPDVRTITMTLPLQHDGHGPTTLALSTTLRPGLEHADLDFLRNFEVTWTRQAADGESSSQLLGQGKAEIPLSTIPTMVSSLQVLGTKSLDTQMATRAALLSFLVGTISRTALWPTWPLYQTSYENLVLSGKLRDQTGTMSSFFLVSGAHDVGFPWGDGQTFWDVLLIIQKDDGSWRRFVASRRWLDGLRINVDAGTYEYRGELYELPSDAADVYFSQLESVEPSGLQKLDADIAVHFIPDKHGDILFPFPVVDDTVRKLTTELTNILRTWLPDHPLLGIDIGPLSVNEPNGHIELADDSSRESLEIVTADTFGEAEHSTFENLREPTLLYGYICAIDPRERTHRVQIHSGTLRDSRQQWASDQLDRLVGELLQREASADILTTSEGTSVEHLEFPTPKMTLRQLLDEIQHGPPPPRTDRQKVFEHVGCPLLTLHLDHYPTAEFQRRITLVRDPAGREMLALEEAMSTMRLNAIDSSDRAIVAIARRDDKFAALDEALDHGSFDEVIDRKIEQSDKPVKDLLVVVKPNFMFSYSKVDPTSFVDPELFAHLVRRLRAKGLQNIKLVEARSTYGTFYDKRSVAEMADYLGYHGTVGGEHLYDIVDLTEEAESSDDRRYVGPHLGDHPIPPTWRDADIRISFAKNKSHPYAFYTLTLKNIYGTLPYEDKFLEYHCNRDIYHTTMEWLAMFPVDYGLIDGFISADGPFGVFADPSPNHTHTIIAGTNLVAVDWVGASKMGLDPMVSRYMKLAVERFGKPSIELWGDQTIYRPWLNVPTSLTIFTNKGLDAYHPTGNLLYAAGAHMDTTHFTFKNDSTFIRAVRRVTLPLRKAMFVWTGEKPTLGNRLLSGLFRRMGG